MPWRTDVKALGGSTLMPRRPQEVRLPWRIDFKAAKWGDFKAQGRAMKPWRIYAKVPGRSILRLRRIVFKDREGRF